MKYLEFRQVGREQWLAQSNFWIKTYIRLFGPLGVHARIRNARVINAVNRVTLPLDAKILDAGCGHGYASFWLAKHHPQYRIVASELDADYISAGNVIATKLKLTNLSFVKASVTQICDNSYYDLIINIDVLEHIQDDVAVLHLFYKALKPGGWLVLHLPYRHQLHRRFLPGFTSHITPDHVRDEYTAEEISMRLRDSNFQIHYLKYGFGTFGELAFEMNYLFWKKKYFRIISALIFHPLSVLLAYLDIRKDYDCGNSLIIIAQKSSEPALPVN